MFGFPQGLLGEQLGIRCKDGRFRFGLYLGLQGLVRPRRGPKRTQRPLCEPLEDRALMATAGIDYTLTGLKWSDPSRITYSIAPDGVYWGHGTDTLNAYFNSTIGTNGSWQRAIARALATWQSVANINIVQVADGQYDEDTRGQSQGDPRFGDIRFGGYSYSNNNQTTLAATAFPPPQGWTIAGDVQINTNLKYAVNGSNYDLYSVMLHETGHSLGLDHVTNTVDVMDGTYQGVRTKLASGDIAGIQAIYGARKLDVYQGQGYGLTSAAPIDLSPALVSASTSTAASASLTKIGDVEWFTFVAPSYATGTWQATASASNLSLLSPKITVYDANMNMVGQSSNPNAWGNAVTVSPSGIVGGQRFYIAVTGATGDVFDTGAYQLSVKLSSGPPTMSPQVLTPPVTIPPVTIPPVTIPPVTIPPVTAQTNYIAPDRYESNNTFGTATRLGKFSQGAVSGVSLNTGADVDYYSFQTAAAGIVEITAAGTWIQVLNSRGGVLAQGTGVVDVSAARNTTLTVRVQSANWSPLASYSMSIAPKPAGSKQGGNVKIGGRVVAKPVTKVVPKPAPRIMAKPAPRIVAKPATRIVAKPAIRLARQEVSASGNGALPGLFGGWTGALRVSYAE